MKQRQIKRNPNRKSKKMVSSMISIKAALISTGIAIISLFLKFYVPIALDFSVSRFPVFWSSCLSWLEPPYLFALTNAIIVIIIASSKYYLSIGDHDGEDDKILQANNLKIHTDLHIVHESPPDVADFDSVVTDSPQNFVTEMERSEVVYEEKDEHISALIDGGDEFAVLRSESNQGMPMIVEVENLPPAEKPLVSDRSGHRKQVKASSKGRIRKKALRVVKPKHHETIENTWKILTEEDKSTTLTGDYRRSVTFGVGAGGDVKPALRKAETFRDVTNYRQLSPPVKMKKEMSPDRDELNRRVEAFIRKCKEQRLESVRLEKEVV